MNDEKKVTPRGSKAFSIHRSLAISPVELTVHLSTYLPFNLNRETAYPS
jgi:hypothetical protein